MVKFYQLRLKEKSPDLVGQGFFWVTPD